MKKKIILHLIFLLATIVMSRGIDVPADIMKPDSINVSGDRLFIVQGACLSRFFFID